MAARGHKQSLLGFFSGGRKPRAASRVKKFSSRAAELLESRSMLATVSVERVGDEFTYEGTTKDFIIKRDTADPCALTVNYSFATAPQGATATYTDDYTASGTLNSAVIPANETSVTVTITVATDTITEGFEKIILQLEPYGSGSGSGSGSCSGYSIGANGKASISIQDGLEPIKCPCDCGCGPSVGTVNGSTGTMTATGERAGGLEGVGVDRGGTQGPAPSAPSLKTQATTGANPHPIVTLDAQLSNTVASATSIEAILEFDSLAPVSVFYSSAGAVANQYARFSLMADASSLPTGLYDWKMTIVEHYASGPDITKEYLGDQKIRNLIDSPYGNRWDLSGLAKLVLQGNDVGLDWGDGNLFWFRQLPNGSYERPPGEFGQSTLVNDSGTYTLTASSQEKWQFRADGKLTSYVTRNEDTTSYEYNTEDALALFTDPVGRTTTFSYTDGLLSTITDFVGRETTFTYDANNRLETITESDPDGIGVGEEAHVSTYGYDSVTGLMNSVTHDDETTTYEYDYARTVARRDNSDGTFELFDDEFSKAVVDPGATNLGSAGNPAPLFNPAYAFTTYTDVAGNSTTTKHDRFGMPLTETDANSNQPATYVRDFEGRVTKIIEADPDGPGAGNPLTASETIIEYFANGNVQKITFPDSTYQEFTYHATFNTPLSVRDQLGNFEYFSYDSISGDLLTYTDAAGKVTSYTYNAFGQVLTVTLPDPDDNAATNNTPVTTFEYNHARRLLTRMVNPDGSAIEYTYYTEADPFKTDLLKTVTDELGRSTTYDYDNLGRTTTVTNDVRNVVGATYVYNHDGMVESMTDADGNVTEYTYDHHHRVETVTQPDPDGPLGAAEAPVTTYEYDDENNTVDIYAPDPDGAGALPRPVTTYAYDAAGRLTDIFQPDPDGLGSADRPHTHYEYDLRNRLVAETDPTGLVTKFVYDSLNRLTHQKMDLDGDWVNTTNDQSIYTTEYRADGSVDKQYDPLNRVTDYNYDPRGLVQSIVDNLGQTTSFAYDSIGRLTSLTEPAIAAGTPPTVENRMGSLLVTPGTAGSSFDLFNVFGDLETPDADLSYRILSNSNPDLFDSITIASGSPRTLLLDYADGAAGAARVVVKAVDPSGLSVVDTLILQVLPESSPTVFVVDNNSTGSGFSSTGAWLNNVNGTSYELDAHYTNAAGNTATWTFSDLEPGLYRAHATWQAGSSQPAGVAFAMYDGAAALQAKTVDQTLAPNDLAWGGFNWEKLGENFHVTGDTVSVVLTAPNATGKYTVADAVRLERIGDLPASAEIEVRDGAVLLADGFSSVAFPTTLGTPLTKTLTVRNVGQQSLALTSLVGANFPAHFSLAADFGDTHLATGEQSTFQIAFDGQQIASGAWSFASSDSNENPFNFTLIDALPAQPYTWRFDMATATSSVPSGYTRVTNTTAYSAAQQFGWQGTLPGYTADYGLSGPPNANLFADVVYSTTAATFLADVPNGVYDVKAYFGRSIGTDTFGLQVYMEGALQGTIDLFAYQYAAPVYRVTVNDGQLTVYLNDTSGDNNWTIAALEIRPAFNAVAAQPLTELNVDFATYNSPVPTGYQRVSNWTLYDSQVGYGWSGITPSSDSDHGVTSDNLHSDGVNGWNSATSNFIVDMANGTYDVTLHFGQYTSTSMNGLNVYLEGALVDTINIVGYQFYVRTFQVTVNDGRLTLGLADVAAEYNWQIDALEIRPAAESAPLPPLASLAVDFGTSTSPVETGFQRATKWSLYTPQTRFGWLYATPPMNGIGRRPTALAATAWAASAPPPSWPMFPTASTTSSSTSVRTMRWMDWACGSKAFWPPR